MSCLGKKYLPQPPRLWNRFENSCAYLSNINDPVVPQNINVPFLKENISKIELLRKFEVYKKGNVLQYKANSSNLTKKQRYSQIAKGMWTNRNTTWATQSETYTNPNNLSLKRVNYVTVGGGGDFPNSVFCKPLPVTPQYDVLPDNVPPSPGPLDPPIIPPIIPPPEPVTPGTDDIVMPPYIVPIEPEPDIVIPDGGSLICSIVENICTGEIIKDLGGPLQCAPTSASDVPGEPDILCWNEGLPTYYPRERRTYGTSGDKWPVNSKIWGTTEYKPPVYDIEINSAIFNSNDTLALEWTITNEGDPVIYFSIYITQIS